MGEKFSKLVDKMNNNWRIKQISIEGKRVMKSLFYTVVVEDIRSMLLKYAVLSEAELFMLNFFIFLLLVPGCFVFVVSFVRLDFLILFPKLCEPRVTDTTDTTENKEMIPDEVTPDEVIPDEVTPDEVTPDEEHRSI